MLVFRRLGGRVTIILESAALDIHFAINNSLDATLLQIPVINLTGQRCSNYIIPVWMKYGLQHFRAVLKCVDDPVLAKNVPDAHTLVPRTACEISISVVEVDARYRGCMAT